MKPVSELSNAEVKTELQNYGFDPGPVTATTRQIYEKKLEKLRKEGGGQHKKSASPARRKPSPAKVSPVKPATPTTPKSARKQPSRKSFASDEGSENELELELPVTPPPAKPPVPGRRQVSFGSTERRITVFRSVLEEKKPVATSDRSPTRKTTAKRTPTPPRPVGTTKRTPLRDAGQSSTQRKVYREEPTNTRYMESFDDDTYDDSMESSRILPKNRRFEPTDSSQNFSPAVKIKNIARRSLDFVSRSIGSNASADTNYKTSPPSLYERHTSKYSGEKLFSGSRYSTAGGEPPQRSFDVSFWIMIAIGAFVCALAGAYFYTANPTTIEKTRHAVAGALRETFGFIYTYAILPTIVVSLVVAAAVVGYLLHKRHRTMKEEAQRKLMELVDQITDIIRDADTDGIAEPHVRDMIMPPTRRTPEDWSRWSEAAEFINAVDSRVRTEIRQINGVECNVWIWVPIKKHGWQGSAVAEGSPMVNIPSQALTRCLKLRNILDGNSKANDGELRRELEEKLSPVKPVHIAFHHGPPEGIVYMMFKNLSDSKRAFQALQSNWFNGNLVSAKYVRDERYAERFPDAVKKA
ncbi:LEM domain containing protein [Aphelenchoides avenae]|nr:LEM domain containing protein [Aphelenchus avenae]